MVVLVLEVVLVVLVVVLVLVDVLVVLVLVLVDGDGRVVVGVVVGVVEPAVDDGDVSCSERVQAAASSPRPPTNALRNNALRPSGAANASGDAGDAGGSTDTRPP